VDHARPGGVRPLGLLVDHHHVVPVQSQPDRHRQPDRTGAYYYDLCIPRSHRRSFSILTHSGEVRILLFINIC
jgi:hypothetical protein